MNPEWKIKKLVKLGVDFKCPFHLPPFDGNIDEGSFDINEFKDTPEFQEFLSHILSLDIHFEYAKYKKRMFLTIKVK